MDTSCLLAVAKQSFCIGIIIYHIDKAVEELPLIGAGRTSCAPADCRAEHAVCQVAECV